MRFALAVLALLGLVQAPQVASADEVVVVELFTSQGCSSCPPADAMLDDLAARSDVIALAMHVDYWDYIGWKDSFGNPAFSQRQHNYARAANAASVYTPQMVFNGQDGVVGSRPMAVMAALEAHLARGQVFDVSVSRFNDVVRIVAQPGPRGNYAIQMVRVMPEATVAIRRGENAGRTITYTNIVTDLQTVTRWDGRSRLSHEAYVQGDDGVVVLVQENGNGPIVGAAQLR